MCGRLPRRLRRRSASTNRNTPCVLGCCGPMLTSISSVRTSNSTMRGRWSCSLYVFRLLRPDSTALEGWQWLWQLQVLARSVNGRDSVVDPAICSPCAAGAPPVFRTEDPSQVGMAGKPDPHQVIDFAFVPVGGAPDVQRRSAPRAARLRVVLPPRQADLQPLAALVTVLDRW